MKLISWNVNGLRACMTKGFADFMTASDADIFCVQETKMQREQATFDFPNYFEYWNSAEKKGYSGTAVFTKKEPLNVTYGLGIDEHGKSRLTLRTVSVSTSMTTKAVSSPVSSRSLIW